MGWYDMIGSTVLDFVEYSLIAVAIMIVYYIYRVLAFSTEEEKEAEEKQRKAAGEWVGKKIEESKLKGEAKKRKEKVLVAKSALIKAIEHGEGLVDALSKGKTPATKQKAVREAKSELKELEENVDSAVKCFRRARKRESGDVYTFFDKLAAESQSVHTHVGSITIPAFDDVDWDTKIKAIGRMVDSARPYITTITPIKPTIGAILDSLDKYIEKGEMV